MKPELWQGYSLAFQLVSINADIRRAIQQHDRARSEAVVRRLETALGYLDLTLNSQMGLTRLRELARLRELVADHLEGTSQYPITLSEISSMMDPYNFMVARERGLA